MAGFLDRLEDYLIKPPLPSVAFQLSSHYMSGIHVSPKERKIKHHFILPLKNSVIQSSFNKKNVKDGSYLEKKIKEGMEKLRLSKSKIALFIPEVCLNVFLFPFVSLPSAQKDKEEIIRWRVKKQMPLLPKDTRLSFEVIKSDGEKKILVTLAKASVIQEYEDFFSRVGLKVGAIGVSTLSLSNLLDSEGEGNLMVINLEDDTISLIAFINSEIVLYRHKPFVLEGQSELPFSQKLESIVKEVENTVNFIEDREKKKINSFWIRMGLVSPEEEMFSILRERLSLPLKGVEASGVSGLNFREKQILSPLIGQILC